MTSNPATSSPTVLITGASTGIGEACAKRFSTLGWRVFAGCRDQAADEALRAAGCQPVRLDVSDDESVTCAMNEISAQLAGDGLDYLVNNAGIATTAPLELIPMDDFRQQMAVNVEGVLLVTQAALPFMRKNTDARQARIVNIGSVSGIVAFPAMGAYCASKFALEAITDSLRMELMAHDIDVCLVQPGPVKTPIWKKSQSAGRARLEQMGQLVNEHYGELMQAMKKSAEDAEKKGVRVERVVEAVEHALTARRPRTRYLVGKGIRQVLWLARLLGDRRRDRIVMKKLGAD